MVKQENIEGQLKVFHGVAKHVLAYLFIESSIKATFSFFFQLLAAGNDYHHPLPAIHFRMM